MDIPSIVCSSAAVGAVLLLLFLSGRAPVRKPMRLVSDTVPLGEQSYVESSSGPKFSCSFVECDGELIKDHGDVWSEKAMEIYAALYRLAASRKRVL